MPESVNVEHIIEKYGGDREALVEILRDVSQAAGYVTPEAIATIAQRLGLPQSQVHSVASFYSLISLKPQGKHVIRFCQDAPCHVAGGREIWETLERELGIPFGTTTADGKWTLLTTSCIGACSVGPVMLVDDTIYGNLTPDRVREILAQVGGEA
ncbi:MAG TPA: NADH-quinone oxidoreductase subunit NuoE [Anaerolineae bacterium]|nr:NADH-quinone oxidoreductase subunit NuoE [Anaerolineae bacterium]HQK14984.1 NADH-quinone oxidoreductase subunit NuoE [Anaerolineae bacterium]